MPLAVFGLSTWKWNNNAKSVVLLLSFPVLILALLGGFFFAVGYLNLTSSGTVDVRFLGFMGVKAQGQTPFDVAIWAVQAYWPIVMGVAIIWVLVGYFFNGAMIRAATGAKPLERKDNPKLYNLLENLCISRGMRVPRLYVMEANGLNAFASGIDERSYSITVSRGLLDVLNDREVEAVLAHELTHIRNNDVRLLVITVVFTGMISFAAQMLWRSFRHAPRRGYAPRGKGNAMLLVLVAAALASIGYLIAMLLRLALSRKREYLADAGSVELTKNPDALVSALRKISENPLIPDVPADVQQMFIEHPPSAFGLFNTHPPIKERIRILREIGGLPREGKSRIPNASS